MIQTNASPSRTLAASKKSVWSAAGGSHTTSGLFDRSTHARAGLTVTALLELAARRQLHIGICRPRWGEVRRAIHHAARSGSRSRQPKGDAVDRATAQPVMVVAVLKGRGLGAPPGQCYIDVETLQSLLVAE